MTSPAAQLLFLIGLFTWSEVGGAGPVLSAASERSRLRASLPTTDAELLETRAELRGLGVRQNENFSAHLKDSSSRGPGAEIESRAREIEARAKLLSGNADSSPGSPARTDSAPHNETSNRSPCPTQSERPPGSSLQITDTLASLATTTEEASGDSLVYDTSASQSGLADDVLATPQISLDSRARRDYAATGSHVLRLRPELGGWEDTEKKAVSPRVGSSSFNSDRSGDGDSGGMVFEEAGERGGSQGEPRSRGRRSWIWNQFFVIEEYSGPEPVLIGRLHSSVDKGDGSTKYTLKGEGAGSVFVIDGRTGNIHVTKPLDREEKDQYRLIATATDRQTGRALEPSSQFIIRVQDINDNPPLFLDGPYSATVPEMANIGTSVIQVTATDADDPTYGNSAKLVYTLVHGHEYFSVDPQTGIIRTAVPEMDRETQDQYHIILQARDMGGHQGGLTGTTTVTVRLSDVNDNPPRFAHSVWSFSVSELAIPGVEVGHLSATDADLGENAKMEYSIVDGDGGDTFNITGLDQEAVIILNKAVDYERRSSYSLTVEVQNPTVDARFLRKGPFKDRAIVQVTVLNADEPPRFSRSRYRLDVTENCPPACAVGRVAAVDPDTGQSSNIRYSIDPESDPEALFRIAPDHGLITTTMELDREREQWHNITIIATQRDNPSQVTRVGVSIETLDLNDNPPELDRQYSTAVCDSSSPGQVVQVLHAVDKDQGSTDSPVHFSIPTGSSAALNFSIRERGGPVANLVLLTALRPHSTSSSSSLSTSTSSSTSSALHTLMVPVVTQDSTSDLSSTSTVTVVVCPCQRGGMWVEEKRRHAKSGEKPRPPVPAAAAEWERQTVCLPVPSASPLLGFSSAAMLAVLGCATTLLVVTALVLSLRRQKRDVLSPTEEDEIHENIITYDDEGGGEADTAAFDILALKSAPHSALKGHRLLDSRNMYSQHNLDRTYSWSQNTSMDPRRPGSAPMYGRFCYSIHTLPVMKSNMGPYSTGLDLAKLPYGIASNRTEQTLVIQTQGNYSPLEPGSVCVRPVGPSSMDGSEHKAAEGSTDSNLKESEGGSEATSDSQIINQDQLSDQTLILTGSSQNGSCMENNSTSSLSQQEPSPQCIDTSTSSTPLPPPPPPAATIEPSKVTTSHDKPMDNIIHTNATQNSIQLEKPHRTMEGTLYRGAGIPSTSGPTYSDSVGMLSVFAVGGRDYAPQLMVPIPGGMLGYGGGWGMGRGMPATRAGANTSSDLTNRMGDFLQHRLVQVTFDPLQPPYDSVQTYGLEGSGSQAGSLSSLESEGDGELETAGGIEGWGPKFNRLVAIYKEREQEKEEAKKGKEKGEVKEGTSERCKTEDSEGKGLNDKPNMEAIATEVQMEDDKGEVVEL